MILHTIDQRSPEWLKLRAGIVTASDLDKIVDTKFELRSGEMLKTYLYKKAAERLLGRPLEDVVSSFDMEQGNLKEEDAYPWFAIKYKVLMRNNVFCTTDDGKCGCSPDGLWEIGTRVLLPSQINELIHAGLEIKCPKAYTHVGYLLNGALPKDYLAQVHGSMYVTGAPFWYFLSYHQVFPPLVLKVERDEEIQKKIHAAVTEFNQRLDDAYKKLESQCGSMRKEPSGSTPTERSPSVGPHSSDGSGSIADGPGLPKEFSEPANLWRGL